MLFHQIVDLDRIFHLESPQYVIQHDQGQFRHQVMEQDKFTILCSQKYDCFGALKSLLVSS